ncbi:MAG: methyltransferase [Firmicutes bacterium]|nr:methyltransferase [Bacillota bacterium]
MINAQDSGARQIRELLQKLERKYNLKTVILDLGGWKLQLIKVCNIDDLLDQVTDENEIPFWAELWPSSIGLAQFILQRPSLFEGKRVLELGAGVGLAGIAAKLCGAFVTQSDFIEAAFDFIRVNCLRNQAPVGELLLADWRRFPAISAKYDYLIGADILYEKTLHQDLRRICSRTLKPGGSIWLADPGRDYGKQFIWMMEADGFRNHQIQIPVFHDGKTAAIDIYQLRPPVKK